MTSFSTRLLVKVKLSIFAVHPRKLNLSGKASQGRIAGLHRALSSDDTECINAPVTYLVVVDIVVYLITLIIVTTYI